ncbi:hypothetical protein ACG2F4_08980 [Halalkalibaculum sp. DA3122]
MFFKPSLNGRLLAGFNWNKNRRAILILDLSSRRISGCSTVRGYKKGWGNAATVRYLNGKEQLDERKVKRGRNKFLPPRKIMS